MSSIQRFVLPMLLLLAVVVLGCGDEEPAGGDESASPVRSESGSVDAATARMASTPEAISQVQSDVRTMVQAVYAADADTVLDYTHPRVFELIGGKPQMRSSLNTMFSQFQALGMALESMKFPEDPTFLAGGQHEFVIVPTLSVMAAKGQRVESLNYQFGAREKGAEEWKYIEGSRINQRNVPSLFPDFPADYVFPPTYRKKL